jgi:tetratricopeptide (TPR) repeat protein
MLNPRLTTWMSRSAAAALLIAAMATLPACTTQRSLPIVREMGDRAFERADYQTASTEYGEYLDRKPGEPRVQLRMAQTLLELGRPIEAVEYAAIAHDMRPGDEEFVETYARALLEAGRHEQLYTFLRSWTHDRGTVNDYIRLGEYTARLGDPDGAEHALLMAAKVDAGQTIRPQLALADFYAAIRDLSNAKRRLQMALFIEPTNLEIHQRLRAMGEIPGPSLAIIPDEAL